jgi:hypothetical protein
MHLSHPIRILANSVNVAFYVKESVEIHFHGILEWLSPAGRGILPHLPAYGK